MSDEDYPRFSEAELDRRRNAVLGLAEGRSLDGVLVFGANRAGSAIQWLSEWPVTREASLVVTPEETDAMWVQFYNHLPNARRFARRCVVDWDGPQTWLAAARALEARGAHRIGVVGPLGWRAHAALTDMFDFVLSLDAEYTWLRLIKSDEELEWMRQGAKLSDGAIEAVREGVRPGVTETELGAICEAAYLDGGATNHIHYFGVTSMSDPTPVRAVTMAVEPGRQLRRRPHLRDLGIVVGICGTGAAVHDSRRRAEPALPRSA